MTATAGPLAALARLRQGGPADAAERCDMCAVAVPADHRHVVDLHERGLVCTCRSCHLLFSAPGAAGGRYRAVPDRYVALAGSTLTAAQWDSLQIPVAVAFFFHNSAAGATAAFFPGPAGATECQLPLDAWEEIAAANPVLCTLQPDVEAVLVRAGDPVGGPGIEGFVVPIDCCYELVGHLRRLWRGFDGGADAHRAVDSFFRRLRERAGTAGGAGRG